MRSGLTQEQLNDRITQQYQAWAIGDGATKEFKLPKNVQRLDDLSVIVDGLTLRPANRGTPFDYALRGVTAGYAGDTNMVKFVVAPANTKNINFIVQATS